MTDMEKMVHTYPQESCALCEKNAQSNAVNVGCMVFFLILFFGTMLVRGLWLLATTVW